MKLIAFISICTSLILSAGCGRYTEKASIIDGSAANDSQIDAETLYRNMPAPDYTVTYSPTIYGSVTTQRQTASQFCRKMTPVVPNAKSSYACWELNTNISPPESMYQYLAAYYEYGISTGTVGAATQEAITADGSIICRKVTPAVLNPVPTYTCYSEL